MDMYKRLLRYLIPYKMRLIWAFLFMGLTSAMISAQTYQVKPMLDKVVLANDMKLGLLLALGLIPVSALKGVTAYVRDYLLGYVGQKIVNNIRDQLYAHIQSLPSPTSRTPTAARITNDVNLVQAPDPRTSAGPGILTMPLRGISSI
jgi:subfamily B ATP-binding cassette protein MsbA